jgi:hypothetical protein
MNVDRPATNGDAEGVVSMAGEAELDASAVGWLDEAHAARPSDVSTARQTRPIDLTIG